MSGRFDWCAHNACERCPGAKPSVACSCSCHKAAE